MGGWSKLQGPENDSSILSFFPLIAVGGRRTWCDIACALGFLYPGEPNLGRGEFGNATMSDHDRVCFMASYEGCR